VRSDGCFSMKNPLAPAGIEPAIFRIVAQHLNHCVTAVPKERCIYWKLQEVALDGTLLRIRFGRVYGFIVRKNTG